MAVVALGHNGIGLGHVSRLIGLCQCLANIGQKPILLAEGAGYRVIPHRFPSASIAKIGDQSAHVRSEIGRAISSLALLTFPSVVIEDTHPLSLKISREVSRVLVVRPIEWSELKKLRNDSNSFHTVLIADHPSSPTWPYDQTQTDQISSWDSWKCVGPLYRRSSKSEILDIKRRYGLASRTRLCVFSMGGGGEHFGAKDAERFWKKARSIGKWLLARDPNVRLVFVGGPMFRRYDLVPQSFTIVRSEPFMPALFAVADAAVIRPGFNSVWECIAGRTPIIPIVGTSYAEPMRLRMNRLQTYGVAFRHIRDCWSDDACLRMSQAARTAVKGWTGQANSRVLRKIVDKNKHLDAVKAGRGSNLSSDIFPSYSSADDDAFTEADVEKLHQILFRKSVSVRVDDVTHLAGTTKALIELCEEFGLGVSLEIVPYFAEISRNALRRCKIGTDLIEVGQHGYSHILRSYRPQPKSEFSFCEVGVEREMDEIAKGKAILAKKFPKEFRNGFSPPFDGMPTWLAECWAQLGGEYLSGMEARPTGARIPFVVSSVDVWNWRLNRAVAPSQIRTEIISSLIRSGHAGLVLHPAHFSVPKSIRRLRELIMWLQRGKVEFVLPSRCARLQSSRVVNSPLRRYASVATSLP